MSETNRFDLTGKVSLITGASRGLGRAIALALAREGADVALNCSASVESAEEVAQEIKDLGQRAIVIKADVSKQDEVKALFRKVDQEFGKLDILFNNAGIATKGLRIHEMPLEDWNKVISVNLTGVFLCLQEGIKLMLRQKSGSIINISSILGLVAIDPAILATSNYVAAKHGIIGLTKSAAVQYASDNIRVNAIAPGFFGGTRLSDVVERPEEPIQPGPNRIAELTPMKRSGQPEELKGLAVLLASDASSFITGATFVLDGGWCAW